MVSRNTNLGADALKKELLNKFLVFSNTENNYLSNVPEASSDTIRDAVFATPILDKNVKKVVQVPEGTRALWQTGDRTGTQSGMYRSDGGAFAYNTSSSNWYTWVNPEGFIFVVLQNVLNANSSNDVIVAKSILANTSGKIFTNEDGIVACCIGMTPSDETFNSYRKHITLEPVVDAYDSLKNSYTSPNTRATSICGAGNERRYGTCCLYYSSENYDRIRGVTYSAGDFYRCTCTECYRCSEMAESLGMQYRFNMWEGTGVTGGTGESCLHCDSEDFPSNCGPCKCAIDWNERTYHYDSILTTSDFSPHTSVHKNAQIAKANDEQGGAVTSIVVDIRKLSLEERTIPKSYRNTQLIVPLLGDFDENSISKVEIITEVDTNGNIVWVGTQVIDYGSGATRVEIDYDTLIATYLPNANKGNLQQYTKVNISPIRGFHLSMGDLYSIRTLLDVQIPKSSISSVTSAININSVSIASGGGIGGGNLFAGNAKNESSVARLTNKLEIQNTEVSEAPSGGGGKGGGGGSSSVSSNAYEDTELNTTIQGGSIVSSSALVGGVSEIEITGRKSLYQVGKVLTINSDNWTTNSVQAPTSPLSGDEIDTRTIKVEHTHSFLSQLNVSQGTVETGNSNNLNVQIYL